MSLDLTNKKILVTGGAGFVGRHVINNLVMQRGVPRENIIVPRSSVYDLCLPDRARDVVRGADVVFHLAAVSGGIGFSAQHPGRMFYENTAMGINIIEASRAEGVEKIIHIGSYNEYPASAAMPLREEDLWGGLPDAAFLPYGMAKKIILTQLQAYRAENGLNGIHLIMASMFGPGGPDTNLIPALIRQIREAKKNGTDVIGWGTGRATRDFLYVEDAAEGIIRAAERYDKVEPINIGSGRESPVAEIISMLCALLEFSGTVRWDPTKPEGQLRYIMDSGRAKNEFGFIPQIGLEEGLRRTVGACREH